MEPDDLVRILLTVPESRLAILALTWQLMGEDGEISPEKAAFVAKELHLATDEVRNSRRAITELTEALTRCR